MASTYTHYIFAREVLKLLPNTLQSIVLEHRQLYDIGCHGFDLLFYYLPLKSLSKNPIRKYSYDMHHEKALPYFNDCIKVLQEHNCNEDSLAYALGFVTHFALDSCVHGYVERATQNHPDNDFTHGLLEVEFDRYLMVQEGKDPVRSSSISHIVSSHKNAQAIYPFFLNTSEKEIKTSLDSMIRFNNVFNAPSIVKRRFVYFLLKIFGMYEKYSSQIISFNGDERCIETNAEMKRRFENAIPIAVDLVNNFYDALKNAAPLSERFNKTFSWEDNE